MALAGLLGMSADAVYGLEDNVEALAAGKSAPVLKAASASSVASRATATSVATVYGGFALTSTAVVYILVRGNSLGTVGVTQVFLDLPRLRLFDAAGQDLATDTSGRPGFNGCLATGSASGPVADYYRTVRREAVHDRDACTSRTLSPGSYTFSVTPSVANVNSSVSSVPNSGEILFEVTLGPAPAVEDNRAKTERLVGGTWTFRYSIGSSPFTNRYSFTTVVASSAVPGDYAASGTDEFGNLVVGTYASRQATWAVLDPGTIIDRFYVFNFSDLNSVSGCYHQINPPGSTNVGQCHSMNGSRSPPKAVAERGDPAQAYREMIEAAGDFGAASPEVVQEYLRLRRELQAPR